MSNGRYGIRCVAGWWALSAAMLVMSGVASGQTGGSMLFVNASATGAGDGTTWVDAFRDLQAALTSPAASGGSVTEIWVAAGTYAPAGPDGDRGATFQLVDGVALFGGFAGTETSLAQRDPAAHVTVLSGDLNGDDGPGFANVGDNARHVVRAVDGGSPNLLDGFTITGGIADGMFGTMDGAGFEMRGATGTATLVNCTFVANRADGFGGAVIMNAAVLHVINCRFLGNHSGLAGGAMRTDGPVDVVNSVFAGNTTGGEGGAYTIQGAQGAIVNCTFFANSAGGGGGAVRSTGGSGAVVDNCVFWGNSAAFRPQILDTTPATVRFSDVQGGWPGTGNINADPLFVNAAGPDGMIGTADDSQRLQPGSPAVDTGNNAFLPADVSDLDGDGNTLETLPVDIDGGARIVNGTVDMGAFEFSILDSDGDGVPDTADVCPGFDDTLDADGDGTPDGCDGCPADAAKVAPGVCGCGVAEVDSDLDGVPDCVDNCPADVAKIEPGICGCGVADADSDLDGVPDCVDNCPGVANFDQADSDGDGRGDPCDNPTAVIVVEQLTAIGATASVRLDASGSSDPDNAVSELTFTWTVDGAVVCAGPLSQCGTVEVAMSFGIHEIVLRVTDPEGALDEAAKTLTVDPAQLAVFDVDRAKIEFGHVPPKGRLKGEIGLPFGVDFSELSPTASISVALAGVVVLPGTVVDFVVEGDDFDEWRFEAPSGSTGIGKFKIDWKGMRFKFKEDGFPVVLESRFISTSETVLEMEIDAGAIVGPFTIDIGSQAWISLTAAGAVSASSVPIETDGGDEEHDEQELTAVLPFGLSNTTVIAFSGGLTQTVDVGQHLKGSVGRFQVEWPFDGGLLPGGAAALPRTLDATVTIGSQAYPGATSLGPDDLRVRQNTWRAK